MISPARNLDKLNHVLRDLGIGDQVHILTAHSIQQSDFTLQRAMVEEAWDIETVRTGYERFLALFRPVWQVLDRTEGALGTQDAFIIRALLMLEYRRVALRDPKLPEVLLPDQWPGYPAFTVCKNIYQAVLPSSLAFLRDTVKTADGPLGPPSPTLYGRFGGLAQ